MKYTVYFDEDNLAKVEQTYSKSISDFPMCEVAEMADKFRVYAHLAYEEMQRQKSYEQQGAGE